MRAVATAQLPCESLDGLPVEAVRHQAVDRERVHCSTNVAFDDVQTCIAPPMPGTSNGRDRIWLANPGAGLKGQQPVQET